MVSGAGTRGPRPDEESADFWRSLARHRIEVQRCVACGRHRFPPMPSCPYCAAPEAEAVEIAGTGTVYSWVTVHRALSPAMADDVPYSVVTVDLDGGGRMFGRVVEPDVVAIGDRVGPVFVEREGWTELRFAPAAPLRQQPERA